MMLASTKIASLQDLQSLCDNPTEIKDTLDGQRDDYCMDC